MVDSSGTFQKLSVQKNWGQINEESTCRAGLFLAIEGPFCQMGQEQNRNIMITPAIPEQLATLWCEVEFCHSVYITATSVFL